MANKHENPFQSYDLAINKNAIFSTNVAELYNELDLS